MAASISRLVLASCTWNCRPIAWDASCTSREMDNVVDTLSGLTSTPTRVAEGTSARSSSRRFATNSALKKLTPVKFPPGRARL